MLSRPEMQQISRLRTVTALLLLLDGVSTAAYYLWNPGRMHGTRSSVHAERWHWTWLLLGKAAPCVCTALTMQLPWVVTPSQLRRFRNRSLAGLATLVAMAMACLTARILFDTNVVSYTVANRIVLGALVVFGSGIVSSLYMASSSLIRYVDRQAAPSPELMVHRRHCSALNRLLLLAHCVGFPVTVLFTVSDLETRGPWWWYAAVMFPTLPSHLVSLGTLAVLSVGAIALSTAGDGSMSGKKWARLPSLASLASLRSVSSSQGRLGTLSASASHVSSGSVSVTVLPPQPR